MEDNRNPGKREALRFAKDQSGMMHRYLRQNEGYRRKNGKFEFSYTLSADTG